MDQNRSNFNKAVTLSIDLGLTLLFPSFGSWALADNMGFEVTLQILAVTRSL